MYTYDVKQVECYINSDFIDNNISDFEIENYLKNNKDVYNFTIDNSYNFGVMKTNSDNVKKALSRYLKNHYNISFYANKVKYIIDYDDIIYIVNKDNFEPIFIAIPNY